MSGKMVLDTPLLVVYENMEDKTKFKRLQKKLVLPYLTNKSQWIEAKKSGMKIPETEYRQILSQLANRPDKDDDLITLASRTTLKVILTEDIAQGLPYINYRKGMLNNQLTVTLAATESRSNLKEYLKMLCTNANKITLCDNYFAQNWDNTSSLFHSIFPRKKLTIEFAEVAVGVDAKLNSCKITDSFVKGIFQEWSVQTSNNPKYSNCHDRYLLIESPEGKVEVLISSGFDHIWKGNPKEITCVFRDVS